MPPAHVSGLFEFTRSPPVPLLRASVTHRFLLLVFRYIPRRDA